MIPREAAEAGRRFEFLRALTPFELALISDVRRHALRAGLHDRLSRYQ